MFESDLHPDRFGRPIDNSVVRHGRHNSDGIYPESSYIKCKKCGFTFSTARFPKGVGEGNVYGTPNSYTSPNGPTGTTVTLYDGADATGPGCPFCHSYNYD